MVSTLGFSGFSCITEETAQDVTEVSTFEGQLYLKDN